MRHRPNLTLKFARALGVVVVPVAMALAAPAWAQSSNDVSTAENAYASVDYATALAASERVLKQSALPHDTLVRATRVAALSRAALGDTDQSREYFIALLAYEPDYKLDAKLGPRFQEPFSEARAYWLAQGRKPGMDVQPLVKYTSGGVLKVTTRDPLNVIKKVQVAYRWAPAREYVTTSLPSGAQQIDIPEARKGSTRLDYYVRALDAKDNGVFEEGMPDSPKAVFVTEPPKVAAADEKSGVFSGPVPWIVGGALVVGGGILAFFALRPTNVNPATHARATFGASCAGQPCD